jgi:MoaA/NifB/PqqE/SkfB family radical SAM enzyme
MKYARCVVWGNSALILRKIVKNPQHSCGFFILRIPMCRIYARPPHRFTPRLEEVLKLGVGSIFLAGGEPLLRRSLVERATTLRGMLLPLFTNGTLIADARRD